MLSSVFRRTSGRVSLFHLNTISVVGFMRSTSFATKPSSAASLSCDDPRSFVVSYLVNSCGLSPQAAASVSNTYNKNLNFRSSQNPDSVLALLTKHGFSQTQITKLVRARPTVLIHNPEWILLPKIQFLSSIGISGTDLASIISANPTLLTSSLEKQLIPCHNFLKTVAHLQDKLVIKALKRCSWFFISNILNTLTPNVALLRQLGMPQSSISHLFTNFPHVVGLKHSRFVKAVEDARQMRFDPSKINFVKAIYVLPTMTDSKWESKYEILGRWGWSKDDTTEAFRRCPLIMNVSDKKIKRIFDFLVNKMGWAWASKQMVQRPETLCRSFEKNIVPKCYVIRALQLKGLIKQDFRLCTILANGEEYFLDRYVTKFEESVPQLLNLYEGKIDLSECI